MYILFRILFLYRLLQNIEYGSLCCTVGPCWGNMFHVRWQMLRQAACPWEVNVSLGAHGVARVRHDLATILPPPHRRAKCWDDFFHPMNITVGALKHKVHRTTSASWCLSFVLSGCFVWRILIYFELVWIGRCLDWFITNQLFIFSSLDL